MTLINYVNRVHFADDILEEALWAEIEQRKLRTVMAVSGADEMGDTLSERFRLGLPSRIRSVGYRARIRHPDETEARQVADLFASSGCEALIAFGPGPIIEFTKLVRLLSTTDNPLSLYSMAAGGAHRDVKNLPDMIAVPSLMGFSSVFNASVSVRLESGELIDIACSDLVPDVTICDPTLAATESPRSQASAGAIAITCCVEALLSPNYNPPADGIALDGLNRALRSIRRATRSGGIEARRELMAASMNAAMVQQKGLGPVHAIFGALDAAAGGTLDRGAVARLLLPEMLKFYTSLAPLDNRALMTAFGVADSRHIAAALQSVFSDLPLPGSLAEMGVTDDQIARAVSQVALHRTLTNGPRHPATADILSILQAIR